MSAILEALVPPVHPAISRQENFSAMPLKTLCSSCHLNAACLPCGMAACDLQRIDGLNFGRRRVKVGQTLYREGDRFQFIYAVRSGTFKSSLMLADGREQISGFYMTGELLGLNGVANGEHASSSAFLRSTSATSV